MDRTKNVLGFISLVLLAVGCGAADEVGLWGVTAKGETHRPADSDDWMRRASNCRALKELFFLQSGSHSSAELTEKTTTGEEKGTSKATFIMKDALPSNCQVRDATLTTGYMVERVGIKRYYFNFQEETVQKRFVPEAECMSSETDLMFLSHGAHVTVDWPLAATDAFGPVARGLGCIGVMMVDETVVKPGCEGRLKGWRSTDDLTNFVESRLKTTYCRKGKWTMKITEERTDYFEDGYKTTHPEQTYDLLFPQKRAELQ